MASKISAAKLFRVKFDTHFSGECPRSCNIDYMVADGDMGTPRDVEVEHPDEVHTVEEIWQEAISFANSREHKKT